MAFCFPATGFGPETAPLGQSCPLEFKPYREARDKRAQPAGLAMRAKLVGFRFYMENGLLCRLPREEQFASGD